MSLVFYYLNFHWDIFVKTLIYCRRPLIKESPQVKIPKDLVIRFRIHEIKDLFKYYDYFFPSVNLDIPIFSYQTNSSFIPASYKNFPPNPSQFSKYCILSAYFSKSIKNIFSFCKSARSQTNACIVLFLDTKAINLVKKMNAKSFFQICQVKIVEVSDKMHNSTSYKVSDSRLFLFWMFTQQCNKNHPTFFKQIMFVDGFDTSFQRDPFDETISNDVIFLQSEYIKYSSSLANMKWIMSLNSGSSLQFYSDNYVVNAGMILGSLKAVERFFTFSLRFILGLINRNYPFDQTIMAFLYYNNIYTLNNISVILNIPPETEYLSLTGAYEYIGFSKENGFKLFDNINSKKRLRMIHQFDRDLSWTSLVYTIYPDDPYFDERSRNLSYFVIK